MQFYLNSLRRNARLSAAAEILRDDAPAFVLVRQLDRLRQNLGTNVALHELAVAEQPTEERLHLVSNYPRLEPTPTVQAVIGPLRLRLDQARLASLRARISRFGSRPRSSRHAAKSPQIRWLRVFAGRPVRKPWLDVGEIWRVPAPSR